MFEYYLTGKEITYWRMQWQNLLRMAQYNGILEKHYSVYEERRNHLCSLWQNELGYVVNFSVPDGGMAIWTTFDTSIELKKLVEHAYSKGLYI